MTLTLTANLDFLHLLPVTVPLIVQRRRELRKNKQLVKSFEDRGKDLQGGDHSTSPSRREYHSWAKIIGDRFECSVETAFIMLGPSFRYQQHKDLMERPGSRITR